MPSCISFLCGTLLMDLTCSILENRILYCNLWIDNG